MKWLRDTTINERALRKLPIYELPDGYTTQLFNPGAPEFPPGHPSYLGKQVVPLEATLMALRDKPPAVLEDKQGKLRVLPVAYGVDHPVLDTIYRPPDYSSEAVRGWLKLVYYTFRRHFQKPPWAGFGWYYPSIVDDMKLSSRAKQGLASLQEVNRCRAYLLVLRYYPEHALDPARFTLFTEIKYFTGYWWTRLGTKPAPDECDSGIMGWEHTARICQWCGSPH